MSLSVDLNRILLFVKIVESGNITKAASILNLPKAKLSRDLALLEQELGLQLAYRTTRQFKLTEAGQKFFIEAKENIENLLKSVSHIKEQDSELSGLIRVTAPEDIGNLIVTPIINQFTQIYPNVSFDLIYTNQVLDIVKLGVDVAIRAGNLKDSTLIQKKAGSIRMLVAASHKYLEKNRQLNNLEHLSLHTTIGFSTPQGLLPWSLRSHAEKKTLKLKHKYVANNFQTIRDLAVEGHGIAYMPRYLCETQLANGSLVHLLKTWGDEGTPLQVAIPHQKNISHRVRTFFDFSVRKLSEVF